MKELVLNTSKREEFIDITSQVQKVVDNENLMQGVVLIFIPHTTAAVTINEGADPSVQDDVVNTLQRLVPHSSSYAHSEGNSDAHIKASMLGSSVTVFVENKHLVLGAWQHIFFYEGDGPRTRKIHIKVVKT